MENSNSKWKGRRWQTLAAGLAIVMALGTLMSCASPTATPVPPTPTPMPAATPTAIPTSTPMPAATTPPPTLYNSYQSNDLGVEFSYPTTWVRQDTQQIVPLFVSPDGIANVGVTRESLPQAMTTDAYFAALAQQLQAQGYILCGTRQTQVGSDSGLQAVYLNKGLLQVFVVVAKGQTAWSLIETAKAAEFIDWANTFNEIAHSFKIQ